MDWSSNPRWAGVTRPYSAAGCGAACAGSMQIEYTLARHGAERLWHLLHGEAYVAALGAMTGNQAIQQVQAGLQAIYVSGWQVAADANDAGQMYPDQSLYPADSVPNLVRRINQALTRADQIHHAEGKNGIAVVCAARGRRGSRIRWKPQRVRTDEGHDRSGRGLRPLRRPALLRQEVRTPGRKSPGADGGGDSEAGGSTAGGGLPGSADPDHGAHRRAKRLPAHQRHRSAGPRVPYRQPHGGRLLLHSRVDWIRRSRAVSRMLRMPT